jgi:hypothetical protein
MKIALPTPNGRCWLWPALAVLLALPITGEAHGIIYEQLPPSPSLGLVQDTNGNFTDPFALYDAQGLRLWGNAGTPAIYNLVFNGQAAFTFTSQDTGFDIDPMASNKVIGGYLDNFGAAGAYPLSGGALIGPDTGTNYTWIGHDPVLGGLVLATERDSGTIGSPILFTGPFAGITAAYIGLQFYSDNQVYYGWVRVGAPATINGGWIYDYAYQTQPNTPILAGAVPLAPLATPQIVRPGNLRLNWQSQTNMAYQVQFKEQLDSLFWTNLDLTIIATATNTSADVPMVGTARFYRVVQNQ